MKCVMGGREILSLPWARIGTPPIIHGSAQVTPPITFGGGYGQQLLHALVLGLRPCGSRDWPHPLARDLLPKVVRLCLV